MCRYRKFTFNFYTVIQSYLQFGNTCSCKIQTADDAMKPEGEIKTRVTEISNRELNGDVKTS